MCMEVLADLHSYYLLQMFPLPEHLHNLKEIIHANLTGIYTHSGERRDPASPLLLHFSFFLGDE